MKLTLLATAFAFSAFGQQAQAQSRGADAARFITAQGWKPSPARAVAMPSADVAAVNYIATGALMPSCGLLAQGSSAPVFTEILAPKAGQPYPHCQGITGAAAFNLGKKTYLALEYVNRSAKDTAVRQYAYFLKDATGRYAMDKTLSERGSKSAQPVAKKSSGGSTVNAGVALARAEYVRKSYPHLQLQHDELIADSAGAFAVLTNGAAANCTFLIDAGPTRATFTQEFFYRGQKCVELRETARLDVKGKLYYVALYTDANKNAATAIFSVDKDNAITAETELAAAAFNEGDKADAKLVSRFLTKAVNTP